MYRALFAIVLLTLLSVTVGCATKEIETDPNAQFKTEEAARKEAMKQTMDKMGGNMRPEQKAAFEKMQSTSDPTKAGGGGDSSTTTTP